MLMKEKKLKLRKKKQKWRKEKLSAKLKLQQLKQLRRTLKLPQTLAQAGISPAQLRQNTNMLAKAAMEDPCISSNPIAPTQRQLEEVLEAVSE